jgi:hypothetical protein
MTAPEDLLTAAVQEAVDRIQATGHIPAPMEIRALERLYNRGFGEGRQSGITQAGTAPGESLPRKPEPAEHWIRALPGSVFSTTQGALPDYGGGPITPAEWYPLTALCHECHKPVRCETAESPWEHA